MKSCIVDITSATGLPAPSVTDVFWFITRWAETPIGKVAIAMVAPPEMITPDKIGITIAANRGLRSEIFTTEAEASEWLRSVISVGKKMNGQVG